MPSPLTDFARYLERQLSSPRHDAAALASIAETLRSVRAALTARGMA